MNDQIRLKMEQKFAELYGTAQGSRLFFAPGRVNLIGEHTDYNGGYVFPAALTFGTYALVRPRTDGVYRFASLNYPDLVVSVPLHRPGSGASGRDAGESIAYRREDGWANYPKGVLKLLIRLAGDSKPFTGADVLFYGNIPNGAGLSSSASIEMATAFALSRLAQLPVPVIDLVKLSQRAENEFIGVNCGIMDQFAVGMGKADHAIRLNCADLSYEYAPLKLDGCKLVVTNTNKRRGLADSKYNERRAECEAGLAMLRKVKPDLRDLGALALEQWEQLRDVIDDPVIRKRVEHVVTEDHRVLRAVERLAANDLASFGQLMIQSHESLRDLYEVTGRELDALVEAALSVSGCIGSRMTGAGFGGCTVSLVRDEALDKFQQEVSDKYEKATGLTPTFYICEIGDGVREIDAQS
jgi:galactokinase